MRRFIASRQLLIETLESRRTFSATPTAFTSDAAFTSEAVLAKGNEALPYTYSVLGNAGDAGLFPAALAAQNSGLALVGGGTDVDEVFAWMGAKANGGDFLVIRATGTDAYNKYIDNLVPRLDSVATLIIPDLATAFNAEVVEIIQRAEAIFIAGGDQANYVNFWNNTPVESALYQAIVHNIPIGGTSAGLAVLGEVDFAALADTISSAEALSNPLDNRIVSGLDSTFLSPEASELDVKPTTILRYMDNVITDSHFMQRDRMGRLLTFMAYSDSVDLMRGIPLGIGINEQTALLVEPNGSARVVGNSYQNKKLTAAQEQRSVYFMQGADRSVTLTENVALVYSAHVAKANYNPDDLLGDVFDLDDLYASRNWSASGLDSYDVFAGNGYTYLKDLSDLVYGEVAEKRRAKLL
jgi:cyanophycinase